MPLTTIACGICMYWVLRRSFPATPSWLVVFPLWFLALSVARTVSGRAIRLIPKVWWATALVAVTYFVGHATVGPFLGFWLPVACVGGTISATVSAVQVPRSRVLRVAVLAIGAAAIAALIVTAAVAEKREAELSPSGRVLALQYGLVLKPELRRLERESQHACKDIQAVAVGLAKPYLWSYVHESLARACPPEVQREFLQQVASGRRPVQSPELREYVQRQLQRENQ